MATDNLTLARTIIDLVGGNANIAMVGHCVTRLRFRLHDTNRARTEELEALDGVLQVIETDSQYQVVIGPEVYDVYDAIMKVSSLWDADSSHPDDVRAAKPQGVLGVLIDLVASIMSPLVGVLASTMMIKGLLALWDYVSVQVSGTSVTQTGAYVALYALCDGFMCYLPIILGFTAARHFKMNTLIGAGIGAALCHPAITALSADVFNGAPSVRHLFEGTAFQMSYATTFFGFPLITPSTSGGYTSTVIPVILACWASSKVFRWANGNLSATIKFFAVPMATLIAGGLTTFLVIGPASTVFINLVGVFFSLLMEIPIVGAALGSAALGALWQILVIFGFHHVVIPVVLSNIATYGYDFVTPGQFGCTWAQIACVLAVVLKTHDKDLRNTGLAAFATGLFGTTEPAIYGVTLPLRLPFVFSCIGGAAAGAFYGIMGNRLFNMGYSGLLGFTAYIDTRTPAQVAAWEGTSMYLPPQGIFHMVVAACGVVIAFVVGFVLTWLFWRPKKE